MFAFFTFITWGRYENDDSQGYLFYLQKSARSSQCLITPSQSSSDISSEWKAFQMSKHLRSTRGFLTHAQCLTAISSGRKKKFTHKATPAPCASHYRRSCCIFLWGYMLSFDTQRSHGVRDAPSHGNSFRRVREMRDRALTVKSIKQRAGFQPNGLHWVTTTSQWFAPRIFPLFSPGVKFAALFHFARRETDRENSSAW